MAQGLNDKASKLSEDKTHNDENEGKDEKRKRLHWSDVQLQGFQSYMHTQLHQGDTFRMTNECI